MVRYAPRTSTAAIRFAKSKVGTRFPPGWCQAWVAGHVFQTGGVGDWDGDRAADAEDGWKAAKVKVPASKIRSYSDIPAGVALYWSGGRRDNGHASVSAGGGDTYTTDLPYMGRIGRVAISEVRRRWGLTFLGYVTVEGHGLTLTDRPSGPVDKMNPSSYGPGHVGAHITWYGDRLVAHGFGRHYTTGPGPTWGEADRLNTRDFQKAQGWAGPGADGLPGQETLKRLAAKPKPPSDNPAEG